MNPGKTYSWMQSRIFLKKTIVRVLNLGTLNNEDRNTSNYVWFRKNRFLFCFLLLSVVLFCLELCAQKMIKSLNWKVRKYWEHFCSCFYSSQKFKGGFWICVLVTTIYRCSTQSIETCSYCIYYCSFSSSSELPSSLLIYYNSQSHTVNQTWSTKLRRL